MEEYEKAHIEANRWELIQSTFCNVQLIARLQQANILQQDDVEDLQRVHLTPLERSRRLYEILPTRVNAYHILIEALEEVRQGAAVRILQKVDPSKPLLKPVVISKAEETMFQRGVDRQKFLQNLIIILNLSAEFGRELLYYINSVDDNGNNIIFMATHAGLPLYMLRGLEELGANWNAINTTGETILHVAALAGNPDAIRYFAQLGVSVYRYNNRRQTPLEYAATTKGNLLGTIQALLDCGANINAGEKYVDTLLLEFIKTGKSKTELEFLVEHGAIWKQLPDEETSYLHQACIYGNNDAVQYFLSLGYNVNTRNKAGETPLHTLAKQCSKNFLECFVTLIENGAEINAPDNHGETPVFKALSRNTSRTVSDIHLMVQSGADVNIRSNNGSKSIHNLPYWDIETQKYVNTLRPDPKFCGVKYKRKYQIYLYCLIFVVIICAFVVVLWLLFKFVDKS